MEPWLIGLLALVGAAVVAYLALNLNQRTPQAGAAAPDFSLPDQTGKPRTLSEFRGRRLVLYFYLRDDTPG